VAPLDVALVHIGLNDHDAAFELLEKAYSQRVMRMSTLLCPMFDAIRPDPRFVSLLNRVRLPITPAC
jgi:hypothetical protein